MLSRPCGGVNTDLLAYGADDALAVMWAEDPAQVKPAHGDPVVSWENPGSKGGLWTPDGAGTVLYNETGYQRPVLTFMAGSMTALELLPVPANLPAQPLTMVVVCAWANGDTGPSFFTFDDPFSDGAGFGGNGTATQQGASFFGSLALASAQQVRFVAPNSLHVAEGHAVAGTDEDVAINGSLVTLGDPMVANVVSGPVELGGLTPVALYSTVAIAFAGLYASATTPAGLIDACIAHYRPTTT